MFTTLIKKEHATRKKMISDRYSKTFLILPSIGVSVHEQHEEFMRQIAKSKTLDMYMLLHYYVLEFGQPHLSYPTGTCIARVSACPEVI